MAIVQAIARDDMYPMLAPLKRGARRGDEPRRALLVTYLIAQAGLLVGGIDAVAPVLTNFFLVTYDMLTRTLTAASSHRPTATSPSH